MNTETNSNTSTESNVGTTTGQTGVPGTSSTLSATTAVATAVTGKAAALAILSAFDLIAVLDASGSMDDPNKAGQAKPTRWEYMQETAITLARDMCTIDEDGIGVCVFSGTGITFQDGCTADVVRQVFKDRSPRGTTPLAEALQQVLTGTAASTKNKIVAILTDGVPDDKAAVANLIRNQANSQERDEQMTFVFIQVGDDSGATAYLNELDEHLTGAKFDIVSAYTIAEADKFGSTAELLAHAISN